MPTRAEVVLQARTYVGSRFAHQGRMRGKAIDCVGLLLCVFEDLHCVDKHGVPLLKTDYMNYGPTPNGRFVFEFCMERLNVKSTEPLPGDIISLRTPIDPVHLAFMTPIGMLHSYTGIGRVAEHLMDAKWKRRIEGVFGIPGIQD